MHSDAVIAIVNPPPSYLLWLLKERKTKRKNEKTKGMGMKM